MWVLHRSSGIDVGVSPKIKRNTIYGLFGLNGARKSTTLNLILGVLHFTKGEILIVIGLSTIEMNSYEGRRSFEEELLFVLG